MSLANVNSIEPPRTVYLDISNTLGRRLGFSPTKHLGGCDMDFSTFNGHILCMTVRAAVCGLPELSTFCHHDIDVLHCPTPTRAAHATSRSFPHYYRAVWRIGTPAHGLSVPDYSVPVCACAADSRTAYAASPPCLDDRYACFHTIVCVLATTSTLPSSIHASTRAFFSIPTADSHKSMFWQARGRQTDTNTLSRVGDGCGTAARVALRCHLPGLPPVARTAARLWTGHSQAKRRL